MHSAALLSMQLRIFVFSFTSIKGVGHEHKFVGFSKTPRV